MTDEQNNDIARRRRVDEILTAMAEAHVLIKQHFNELGGFGVSRADGIRLVAGKINDPDLRGWLLQQMDMDVLVCRSPMSELIQRLFAEAPKLRRAGVQSQAPALECFVTLSGTGQGIQGVLSQTPEGTMRMLATGRDEHNKPVLIEHFFDASDITVISLRRDVSAIPTILPSS